MDSKAARIAEHKKRVRARLEEEYWNASGATNYSYFRDYDPSLGRYAESDPIGLKDGLNTFVYVASGAIERADRFGLAACMAGDPMCDIAMRQAGMPVPEPYDSPCGADGGTKFPKFSFGKSCEAHDKCYDKCGTSKALCEPEFLMNMQLSCGLVGMAPCRLIALQYYDAVMLFGGSAFNAAQKNACPAGKCRKASK